MPEGDRGETGEEGACQGVGEGAGEGEGVRVRTGETSERAAR